MPISSILVLMTGASNVSTVSEMLQGCQNFPPVALLWFPSAHSTIFSFGDLIILSALLQVIHMCLQLGPTLIMNGMISRVDQCYKCMNHKLRCLGNLCHLKWNESS